METKRLIKIAICVIVAALVLIFGIEFLKGINLFKSANYYYASYTDVEGLNVAAPITLNGFKVGQVRDIQYEYDNPGHVKVELSLDKKLKVPKGSAAMIESDLLGTASIVLKFSEAKDYYEVGATIEGT
ncbi:MAG: MCE family protein, partial [Muribaculaceae bacterium]|nr:MCE family protein [Muribaculaceae bacterium]